MSENCCSNVSHVDESLHVTQTVKLYDSIFDFFCHVATHMAPRNADVITHYAFLVCFKRYKGLTCVSYTLNILTVVFRKSTSSKKNKVYKGHRL